MVKVEGELEMEMETERYKVFAVFCLVIDWRRATAVYRVAIAHCRC